MDLRSERARLQQSLVRSAHYAPRERILTFLFLRADHGKMDRSAVVAFLKDDRAQGLVEYALIIALIAMVAVAALRVLGTKVNNTLNKAAGALLS